MQDSDVRAVLRGLSELGVKEDVIVRFRAQGGSLERWRVQDWDVMADAITRAEDVLEYEDNDRPGIKRVELRSSLRALRRTLEALGA